MPFGCTMLADGVRFALWAPGASTVDLCLDDHQPPIVRPMEREDGGWFGLSVAEAHAGSRYCFAIDGGDRVPDPASRWNPDGVHGASRVVDPMTHGWRDDAWNGRPWHETVICEVHVGTFTAAGTFDGVAEHLDELAATGFTAIELMPFAAFAGTRNWGYDGVLPFAPAACYGTRTT